VINRESSGYLGRFFFLSASVMIMLMEQIWIYVGLVLFGLCLGSFAGASVWRLRARQLEDDKAEGEEVDAKEYKQLKQLHSINKLKDRSRCLHCGHELAWYDLLPLVSWLSLRGKCRYCRVSIGRFEPLIELGVAAFFVLSYILWPHDLSTALAVAQFILWLAAGVGLAILFVYDLKWFLLPNRVMFSVIGISAVSALVVLLQAQDVFAALLSTLSSIFILSGLYLLIYIISKGQWIGFGDIKLGLALALLLADWRLALLALFAANLIGCLIVIPGMLAGKITRTTRIPFGPLLILGMVVAAFAGDYIIGMYFGSLIL
jgi:prepilin signal peptidase PulO-like enzyme (type II secretory pathway)